MIKTVNVYQTQCSSHVKPWFVLSLTLVLNYVCSSDIAILNKSLTQSVLMLISSACRLNVNDKVHVQRYDLSLASP